MQDVDGQPLRPSLAPFRATYTEAFSDVTLLVDCSGEVSPIPAHKAMLCRSEYFAGMFSVGGLREGSETEVRVCVPRGVSRAGVIACVRFLYAEPPDMLVYRENALEILRAADFFLLADMLECAARTLMEAEARLEECVGMLDVCNTHVALKTENIIMIPTKDEVVSVCKDESDPFWAELWHWAWGRARQLRAAPSPWCEPGALRLLPRAEMLIALLLQDAREYDDWHRPRIRSAECVPDSELDAMLEEILAWCRQHGLAENLLDLLRVLGYLDLKVTQTTASMDFWIPMEQVMSVSSACSILRLRESREQASKVLPLFGVWRVAFQCGRSREHFFFLAVPTIVLLPGLSRVVSRMLAGLLLTKVRTTVKAIAPSGETFLLATEEKPVTHHIQPWVYPKRFTGSLQEVNMFDERVVQDDHVQIRVTSEACMPLVLLLLLRWVTRRLHSLTGPELTALPESLLVVALESGGGSGTEDSFALFNAVIRWADADRSSRTEALSRLLPLIHVTLDGQELHDVLATRSLRSLLLKDATTATEKEEEDAKSSTAYRHPVEQMQEVTSQLRPQPEVQPWLQQASWWLIFPWILCIAMVFALTILYCLDLIALGSRGYKPQLDDRQCMT